MACCAPPGHARWRRCRRSTRLRPASLRHHATTPPRHDIARRAPGSAGTPVKRSHAPDHARDGRDLIETPRTTGRPRRPARSRPFGRAPVRTDDPRWPSLATDSLRSRPGGLRGTHTGVCGLRVLPWAAGDPRVVAHGSTHGTTLRVLTLRGRVSGPCRGQRPASASRTGTNFACASASSASGSESATMPQPANSRTRAPSTSAERSPMPHSPSPAASIQPTGPA